MLNLIAKTRAELMSNLGKLMDSGAKAIVVEATPQWKSNWKRLASRKVSFSSFSNQTGNFATALIILTKAGANAIAKTKTNTHIEIGGKLDKTQIRNTWNSVGMIKGSDPKLSSEVVLLSAHMDHVGVRKNAPGEDKIFNGADDDASGCVAVLEIARILARGNHPKRTVYFAVFRK